MKGTPERDQLLGGFAFQTQSPSSGPDANWRDTLRLARAAAWAAPPVEPEPAQRSS
jgi:hypothetical protein